MRRIPGIAGYGLAAAALWTGLAAPSAAQTAARTRPRRRARPRCAAPATPSGPPNLAEASAARHPSRRSSCSSSSASNGCGNCQRMDTLLYPAFDFEALLIPMVPVKLDLDSAEGKELAAALSRSTRPRRSWLITTPEGRLVFLMQGFQDAPEFYSHVHKDLDAYREFARKIDAAERRDTPGRRRRSRPDASCTGAAIRAPRCRGSRGPPPRPDATPAVRDEALRAAGGGPARARADRRLPGDDPEVDLDDEGRRHPRARRDLPGADPSLGGEARRGVEALRRFQEGAPAIEVQRRSGSGHPEARGVETEMTSAWRSVLPVVLFAAAVFARPLAAADSSRPILTVAASVKAGAAGSGTLRIEATLASRAGTSTATSPRRTT